MPSSEQRSSSAVRNLRSIFENKNSSTLDSSNSPDSRGRSPSGIGGSDKENGTTPHRPTSKVRASFIPVEPSGSPMAANSDSERTSTADMRRGVFSEADGEGELSDLKRTISEEQNRWKLQEVALESAAGTPMPKKAGEGQLGHVFPFMQQEYDQSQEQNEDKPPGNPDKPVTGAEGEPSEMKPAEATNEDAVSGGQALPPVVEDLRSSTKPSSSPPTAQKADTKKPVTNGKPAAISAKAPSKTASTYIKSPASQCKSPTSARTSSASTSAKAPLPNLSKAPAKKASRSSLAAPTAASMAHTRTSGDKPASTNIETSPTSKSKPREVTKPVSLPSHLTAPTASSRAKHEPDPAPAPASRTSTTRPKQPPSSTSTAKATSRASLGPATHHPNSRESHAGGRRSMAAAPDSSFLERMTKPTASSASKTHQKVEAKSPPRQKAAPAKTKVNGEAFKAHYRTAEASKKVSHASPFAQRDHEDPTYENAGLHAEGNDEIAALAATTHGTVDEFRVDEEPTEPTGNETPIAHTNGESSGALEATPAALGSEETIR